MSETNKLCESHLISPETREMAIHESGECRFFVTIQGVRGHRSKTKPRARARGIARGIKKRLNLINITAGILK